MERIKFERGELIKEYYRPYLTCDGTLFCVGNYVHVLFNEKMINANKSWRGDITHSTLIGRDIYFLTSVKKIYKATCSQDPNGPISRLNAIFSIFSPSIRIEFVRDLEQGEEIESRKFLRIIKGGKKFVYRLCDLSTEGIEVDVEEKELKYFELVAIHRKKLIFMEEEDDYEIPFSAISSNIIYVSAWFSDVYSTEDSPLVYFLYFDGLHVLDVCTMTRYRTGFEQEHPALILAGVRVGKIIVKGQDNYLYTAEAPPSLIQFEQTALGKEEERESQKQVAALKAQLDSEFKSKFQEDFKPIRELGKGGFGCVVEAEHILDEGNYAVKLVPLSISAGEVDLTKALKEAKAMARFDHPNIVRYYGSWVEKPPPQWKSPYLSNTHCIILYIQMQLCKNSLANWLRDNQDKHRDSIRMKAIFKQIVEAVAYLHEKEKIHRDLKPENILFNDNDQVKVCDLGIASDMKIIDGEEVACTRTAIGTPLYSSPEQFWSKSTSKMDMFTLGLIYVELLVPMRNKVRQIAFDNYRWGHQNENLAIDDPQTRQLISRLTKVNSGARPSCREVLNEYLQ